MPVKCRCPECNALLSLKSLPAEIDCPKCGASFEPNAEGTEAPPKKKAAPRPDRSARSRDDADERPARRGRNRDVDDDDDDDDYAASRGRSREERRGRKSMPTWLPISIGGGVLAIVIVIILVARGGKDSKKDARNDAPGTTGFGNTDRRLAQNYLRQIALGVHIFHDSQNRFPFPGVSGPKGQPRAAAPNAKPNLSWRVAILPYVEQQDLYDQFHMDEPWDSEHNKKLIPRMPKIYATDASDASQGQTHLRVFDSPGTFGAARSFSEIPDGTSNTIIIVE
jgi:hypothetical protein